MRCVRAPARVCVCARVCARVCVRVCARVCVNVNGPPPCHRDVQPRTIRPHHHVRRHLLPVRMRPPLLRTLMSP